jgi:hypothetical protein
MKTRKSKVATPFYTPTSSVRDFWFLCILTKTYRLLLVGHAMYLMDSHRLHYVHVLSQLLKATCELDAGNFTPVILATWEAENERLSVQGQPGEIVPETPISKIT